MIYHSYSDWYHTLAHPYPRFQSVRSQKSDIGGAAGLFLGISVGTIIGCIDCVIISILNSLKIVIRRKREFRNFERRYENDFRRSSWSSYEQAMIREYWIYSKTRHCDIISCGMIHVYDIKSIRFLLQFQFGSTIIWKKIWNLFIFSCNEQKLTFFVFIESVFLNRYIKLGNLLPVSPNLTSYHEFHEKLWKIWWTYN